MSECWTEINNFVLFRICCLLAEQSVNLRENDQAIQYYKEAIKYAPSDVVVMGALAKLYMQRSAMEQCQQVCGQMLQVDSKNEAASVMMADLSFRRVSGFNFNTTYTDC